MKTPEEIARECTNLLTLIHMYGTKDELDAIEARQKGGE